jgi:hypothetical protein
MNRNRWLLWVGLPAVLALVALAIGMTRKQERTFFTAKVEKGDVISVVQATGTINSTHLPPWIRPRPTWIIPSPTKGRWKFR